MSNDLTYIAIATFTTSFLAISPHALGQQCSDAPSTVTVDRNGTVHIPAYALPLSTYMSDEAKRAYTDLRLHWPDVKLSSDVSKNRAAVDSWLAPQLNRVKAAYPVVVEETRIAGVPSSIVMPKEKVAEGKRHLVLINLHGGGLMLGAGTLQLIESIPVAATAKLKVISINYRQAPEHKFPAASEDIAAVYRELLRTHDPQDIGIYGHSSGSALVAMTLAWFLKEEMPLPGAIAMLFAHSGTGFPEGGDSFYTAPPLFPLFNSRQAPPPILADPPRMTLLPYLSQAEISDPLVSPMLHPEVFAKFPPTLIITATRDVFASGLIHTHRQLVKAGVDSRLELWEGMWSGFNQDASLPESREVYEVAAKFFSTHLGKHPTKGPEADAPGHRSMPQ